jgi:hypothetical protein
MPGAVPCAGLLICIVTMEDIYDDALVLVKTSRNQATQDRSKGHPP